ncbi:MAG: hypothetical protein IT269_12850 [Saprospiraceae bacterium]|nr:hypothetical protein [Saprospiraceae bacterium]
MNCTTNTANGLAYHHATSPASWLNGQPDWMDSDVVFGSPRNDCEGTGICRISGFNSIQSTKKTCRKTRGLARFDASSNSIIIQFRRTMMCPRLYANHFYTGRFHMSDPCWLGKDLCRKINQTSVCMMPGTYAVQEKDGWIRVVIPVTTM